MCDATKRPLTIRNLQMIVARIAYYSKTKNIELTHSVELALRDEFGRFSNDFENKLFDSSSQYSPLSMGDYIAVPSRREPLRLLCTALGINAFTKIMNKSEFGINGVLIEGESGIGKTKMVTAVLDSLNEKYLHITPTDPDRMEKMLTHAFHHGQTVVIDEINTLPLEKLLNSLLSGVDAKGNKAKIPGFFVIGTMNPSYFANRIPLSDAFLNRFYKIDLPAYEQHELVEIVMSITKDEGKTKQLIDEHNANILAARENNQRPPTPRDLFARASELKLQIGNNLPRR
jgi:Holliday junction resolvasome RuvABC ATP-dependent DNA helicase subunit